MIIFFILQFLIFTHIAQSALLTSSQQLNITNQSSTASTLNQKPVYKIGIIFPNATEVKIDDANLANMILTSDVAIQLAANSIKSNNILPGTQQFLKTLSKLGLFILS